MNVQDQQARVGYNSQLGVFCPLGVTVVQRSGTCVRRFANKRKTPQRIRQITRGQVKTNE